MKQSKRFSIDERVLKWTKRHKRRNSIYTGLILIIAIILLVFVLKQQDFEPVKAMNKGKDEIKLTYLGNVELNNHTRKTILMILLVLSKTC